MSLMNRLNSSALMRVPTKRCFLALCASIFIARSSCSLSVGSGGAQRIFGRQSRATSQPWVRSAATANDDGEATTLTPVPIVYTIAGSDSGGGAGIQADLHAIHAFGCHGCSAITSLTAQNSQGVSGVHTPPTDFLQQQLDALTDDLPPMAVKIGMLGSKDVAMTVSNFLKRIRADRKVWVVLDPVMISTSGHNLIGDETVQTMIKEVFPHVDVVTPNKFEAEALLGRRLSTPEDIEQAARDIIAMGCKAVLIKGGHTLIERNDKDPSDSDVDADTISNVESTLRFAQDYFMSTLGDGEAPIAKADERLCDGERGVWLRCPRWDSEDTHGTGCTLSSAMAAALALGEHKRRDELGEPQGATSAIEMIDACCLAKAYVSAGIQRGVQLGQGPGPVVQTVFPASSEDFPSIVSDPRDDVSGFIPMTSFDQQRNRDSESSNDETADAVAEAVAEAVADDIGSAATHTVDTDVEPMLLPLPTLGRIFPIVNSVEWIEKLSVVEGIEDIQLRIKGEKDPAKLLEMVKASQKICSEAGIRLWVNDYWKLAIEAGSFGVHVGQEDLVGLHDNGGLEMLKLQGIALGVSTHSYGELAAALGIKPSYISMGPIFATSSKKLKFDPQGLRTVAKWRELIPDSIPFMTIGGIGDDDAALKNRQAGADSVAVIGAITGSDDIPATVKKLNDAMF